MAQLRATGDARRTEVTEQLRQAEREAAKARERYERVKRVFQDGRMDPDDWREQRDELVGERGAADAQAEQLRARERELWSESMTETIDAATAEQLTEVRRAIVEHVRGAGDVDAVRASLLAMFERFTLRDGQIDLTPREEAIVGWKLDSDPNDRPDLWPSEQIVLADGREVTGVWPRDEEMRVSGDSVMRRVALGHAGNSYSSASPSQ
jgi:hypothetical protein